MKSKMLPVWLCIYLTGCTYTVKLTVKNDLSNTPPPPNLNIAALAKDNNGVTGGTTHLGTAGPGQQVQGSFKVKKGGSYSVHGDLSSGVTVYTGGDKTIESDTSDTVDITKLSAPIIDPSDTAAITASFGRLGPNVGFNPTTVPSVLSGTFGGLVYFLDATQDGQDTQPVVVVPPAQLTGGVDPGTFQYPSGHDTEDETISTDASIKVGASVPLWGSLAAGFSANSVYKMHWSMQDFGNVQKTDTVSYLDKLGQLSQSQKDAICNMLNTQHSHVMYVNSLYVIKSVVLSYQKGNQISSSASLSGGSVITASAAYDFSSSQTQEAEADDRVVNIAGPTYEKGDLPICPGAPKAPGPAIVAQPLVSAPKGLAHPVIQVRTIPK